MNRRRSRTQLLVTVGVLVLLLMGFMYLSRPPVATPQPGVDQGAVASTAGQAPRTASTSQATSAGQATDPASGLRWVSLTQLPAQASDTMKEMKAGPPYQYPANDGVVYHNSEGVLPKRADGYYHEFTVVTPGSSTRGARRIVAGGPNRGLANNEFYYTGDHYSSFERIRV